MNRRHPAASCRTLLLLLVLLAPWSLSPAQAVETISQSELLGLIENGDVPLILDVRTRNEFNSGHVPRAINIPHRELAGRLAELGIPKSGAIVTYCERGPRAGYAESVLRQAGYTNIRSLKGHMNAWRIKRRPTVHP